LAFFIDMFAIMHFTLWFKLKGLKMGSPKKIARYWLPMLLELLPIPLIDFCLTTLGVVLTIGITWVEDGTGLKVPSSKKGLKPKNSNLTRNSSSIKKINNRVSQKEPKVAQSLPPKSE